MFSKFVAKCWAKTEGALRRIFKIRNRPKKRERWVSCRTELGPLFAPVCRGPDQLSGAQGQRSRIGREGC